MLLDFLKYNEREKIYLVGDIVDGWHLRRSWYWPQAHNDIVQKSCINRAKDRKLSVYRKIMKICDVIAARISAAFRRA